MRVDAGRMRGGTRQDRGHLLNSGGPVFSPPPTTAAHPRCMPHLEGALRTLPRLLLRPQLLQLAPLPVRTSQGLNSTAAGRR